MYEIPKLNDQEIYTIKNISELYKIHNNINKYYHFTYKTEQAMHNFGNFPLSILDKECHHTILNDIVSYLSGNSLILIPNDQKNKCKYTIAYSNIPENYKFDIINSTIDGKTLVIYEIFLKINK